jgi:NMD protein affecting ribosome stability and mRNA decay
MKLRHQEYFEGILQLRDIDQTVYDWVYDTIEHDDKATVAKEKYVRNGFDLYLSDQHYLQALGRKIKAKFPGELIISRRLHSTEHMTQKLIYRVTVLFRQLPFTVGQVLDTDDGEWKVLHVGNQVRAQEVKSGKKKMFKFHELARYAKRASSPVKRFTSEYNS